MTEVLATVIVLVVLFAAIALGAYLIVRALFVRAADRAAQQVANALNRIAEGPAAAAAGRMVSSVASRAASRPSSGWARYGQAEGIGADRAKRDFEQGIERLARLMDAYIRIPVIGPVGIDAILGLFPFVGDATSAVVSLTLVARSLKYGIPRELVAKMLANVLVDVLLGAVPIVGDLADIWFRANLRNTALLREYLERSG